MFQRGWQLSQLFFSVAQDTCAYMLLKDCGHMWTRPPLDVVWAVRPHPQSISGGSELSTCDQTAQDGQRYHMWTAALIHIKCRLYNYKKRKKEIWKSAKLNTRFHLEMLCVFLSAGAFCRRCLKAADVLRAVSLRKCWGWLGFQRYTACFHSNLYFRSLPFRSTSLSLGRRRCYAYRFSRRMDVFCSSSLRGSFCSSACAWTRSGRSQTFPGARKWGIWLCYSNRSQTSLPPALTDVRRVSLPLMVWINSEDTQQPLQGALRLSDVAT